ncbi:MAG: L,D-transpeptidase family protein [Verrucomicrobia bacterium]|nr:MAG: L,D-transpeptidase family protein [Verrucomicrobiota bacterium]
MGRIQTFLAALLWTLAAAGAFELPAASTQCVVGLADAWDSSRATLSFYEKRGGAWQRIGSAWPARLGRDGLVWGLGMHPLPAAGPTKREGDWRAPAGVFSIGGVWGYAADIRKHSQLPYHQVGPRDLWIEDPTSRDYNRHLLLDHDPANAWEKKQQMKQGDPAHALKLFIAHNAPPTAVARAGSSIFFHIWRADGGKPTAGCTTMAEARLRELISRLDPARKPLYVLLPKAEYAALRAAWKLP